MKKIWVANIVRDMENGMVGLSYPNMDMNNHRYLPIDEFIEEVEGSDYWDFIDYEVYKVAFEGLELDLSNYGSMEEAWEDFVQVAKSYK